MNKFIVLFLTPISVIDKWMETPKEERDAEELKMRTAWNAWMETHKGMIKETQAAGKTKRVTSTGSSDARNEIMLYSIIEAESADVAAKAYESHPHLGIPEASIEITAIRAM